MASFREPAAKDGITMNRMTYLSISAMVLAGALVASSSAQTTSAQGTTIQSTSTQNSSVQTVVNPPEPSLGNYARALKNVKKEQATKKFDNDNLPVDDKLSVVGSGSDSAGAAGGSLPGQTAPSDPASADASKGMPAVTPGQSAQEREQVYDQWKNKLSNQQAQIDQLSHDLDAAQREYKVHEAEFSANVSERITNPSDKDASQYQQAIADKQKALDEARQKLGDMQEDARKAGVPSSVREGEQPQE
jgi:hypothetical protein